MDLTSVIKEGFITYAGAVLQSRALVDVRDCIKPSARQIFYSMHLNKLVHSKPFKKTNNAVGLAMVDFYIHGDSSAEGVIMRGSQEFAMRYPLVDVEGNNGNLMSSENWAAARYTSSRLSALAATLFEDIEKETIKDWRDNYDDTKQYPAVLPTKGFYNIVNGTMGIGIGMSSSIPAFNLREVNEALVKLLWNPEIDFEEIYCAPDFATGAILLNEEEVKESLKVGRGKSCKLRSVVEFDAKERCFVVTEIPYSVYTNTICKELEAILEGEENPGIDRFNDLTGSKPLIKIYLNRKANPDRVLHYLYKNTSLQSHYGINMTMLEDGRFPKVFGWKEALQAHLDHEKEVYIRGYKFDLKKLGDRLHIVKGILIALARIEEVIQVIKQSTSTKQAKLNLQENFMLDDIQAQAILNMRLARLAHLEVKKFESERDNLVAQISEIEKILASEELLKKEIEKGLVNVAKRFGDSRRTKILNLEKEDESATPTEVKSLLLHLTNQNNIFLSEVSSLYTQRKGGVGSKFKLNPGEYVISTNSLNSTDLVLFFTQVGKFYHYPASEMFLNEKIPVESLINIDPHEEVRAITAYNKKSEKQNIVFFTKQGRMKKSLLSEYNTKRAGGVRAIKLSEDDEISTVLLMNEENVGILTRQGNFIICETKNVKPIGRVTQGVMGIKLNEGDSVVSARSIPDFTTQYISITGKGYSKRTKASEFVVTGRNTKGAKLQKLKDEGDYLVDFLPIVNEEEVVVTSTKAQIKFKLDNISLMGRNTQGARSIKLGKGDSIIGISKS
jgi:DNA gyrase subunit A